MWYFVDDKTPFLPFPTRFGSGNWASARDSWPGPGEVLGAPRPWRNGKKPGRFFAKHFCGTAEEFMNGLDINAAKPVPITSLGEPQCCVGPANGCLAGGRTIRVAPLGSYIGIGGFVDYS